MLFDDNFYRDTYADVAAVGFDRFRHFMDHGWREGRNPSATIDTLFCRDVHLGGANTNPLLFLATVDVAGTLATVPSAGDEDYARLQHAICAPYFCERHYRARSGYDGVDALGHHLSQDWRTASPPSPLFDPAEHVQQHRFLAKQRTSPLYHSRRSVVRTARRCH